MEIHEVPKMPTMPPPAAPETTTKKDAISITDHRTGKDLRPAGDRRDHPRDGPAPDQDRARGLRPDVVRPRVHEHRVVQEQDHVHRRGQGDPALPRVSHRAARRELHLPRGGLPAALRGAAQPQAVRGVGALDHVPHDDPRVVEEVHGRLQLRRAPDGDADRDRRRHVHLLPGRAQHPRPGLAHQADLPPDRQDADAGGVRLPPQHGDAVRVPGQLPLLRRELPEHALQDAVGELQAQPDHRQGPRRPLHPPRRPRAELRHARHAGDRLLARRIRTRRSPAPPRPSTARSMAEPTRKS